MSQFDEDKNVPNSEERPASDQTGTSSIEAEWQAFRAQADADWAIEEAEEMRLRREVLPTKVIPFPSPVSHPDIVIDENAPVRMRDGVILRADVYRPKAEGRYPVTINRGPYDKCSTLDLNPSVARNLAERGYVCVVQDVRGRYASEGEFTPFVNEIEDGVDTVEWAAEQPWSTGRVGMFGISYNGWVQFCAAIGQAPHLCCIYPGMIGYGFDLKKSGIPPLQLAAWSIWAGLGRECKNPLRVDYDHLPLNEIDEKSGYPSPQFEAIVTVDLETMTHGEIPDEVIERRLARIKTPTYTVGGWYDVVLTDTLDTWLQMKKTLPDLKLMIGPWHHNLCDMEQPRFGKVPTDDVEVKRYYEQMEMFFAHHLKGEENDVSRADAPVKLYVMGRNIWRYEHEWPLERTQYRSLYLSSSGDAGTNLEDGVLDWAPPQGEQTADEYDYDPLDPVSWWVGSDVFTFLDEMPGREEIENRDDVLVYTTPALEEDVEVTGEIAATVYAASDAEDTDFVVALVDFHPNGHTQYLSSGIIRARYRDGVERPELIEPGKVYKYEIRMNPTSIVFLQGHRIRIEITSSDFDFFARNQNVAAAPGQTAEVRVAHQAILHSGDHLSHVVLPVIPASAGDEE